MALRELLKEKGSTVGGWCVIPSVFSAELMGRSGFDWVCVDTQHGLVGYDQMVLMLQGLSISGTPAVVRVPWNQPDHIMKALDAGAEGVIVPMVNSAEDAERAVGAAKYPPLGTRSWGPIRASLDVPAYSPEEGNRRTLVIPMIETPDGIKNLDDILAVPGVDAIYVGPSDLALGHGMTPTLRVTEAEHERLVEEILAGCKRHDVIAGIHCDSVETARRWQELGFGMVTVVSDAVLMQRAATAVRQALSETARDASASARG